MALTKAVAAVDEWAEVAQNAVREGTTVNLATYYEATLHIAYALTSETAHTGSKISIQGSSTASGDENWYTITELGTKTGTANKEDLTATEPVGETVIAVASTTGLYDDDETRWIFIENSTVANSELCLLVSHSGDASVTIQDGLTNEQTAAASDLYDIADAFNVSIPSSCNRVRVIYDNTVDADGATIHTYCRVSGITAI